MCSQKMSVGKSQFKVIQCVIERSAVLYSCTVCNEKLPSLDELRHHASNHQNDNIQLYLQLDTNGNVYVKQSVLKNDCRDKPQPNNQRYICAICHKQFRYVTYLKNHLLKVHVGGAAGKETEIQSMKYSCEVCNKKFRFQSKLKAHTKTHKTKTPAAKKVVVKKDNRKREECEICKKKVIHLGTHMQKAHSVPPKPRVPKQKAFPCSLCGKVFKMKANMQWHEKSHTRSNLFHCDICRQSFTHSSSLKQHYYTHSGEKRFECEVCGRCFSKNHNLTLHLRLHSGNLPFECKVCGKRHNTKAQLQSHLIIHTKQYPFSCEMCDKGFRIKCQLMAHLDLHSATNSKAPIEKKTRRRKFSAKPFACTTCSKTFKSADVLERHESTHAGKFPFKCKVCNVGYIKEPIYLLHLKQHEEEVKETGKAKSQTVCEICGAHFKFRHNLKIHLKVHAGDLPFKCTECGKKFICKLNLKNHIAAIHTKDYPLRCPVCDMGFCKQCNLREHLNAHYTKPCTKEVQEPVSEDNESD